MPKTAEKTRMVEISRVVHECTEITSIWFSDEETRKAKPGQYLMVWIPGIDEVPMSISDIDNDGQSRISIRVIGQMTQELVDLNPGDKIGIKGPYGNGYKVQGKHPLFVAGGSGTASLMPFLKQMVKEGIQPTVVLGARSADMLLFVEDLEKLLGEKLVISTDDGSRGYSGYASGYAAKLMESNGFDSVYTCGPELMMAKVFKSAEENELPLQASLERYVKCAEGLCGSCAIGKYRVCKDGPVFDTVMLREVREEFAVSKLDPTGRVVRVDH
ncbi:MAG: dihydroorotate dehydrogenase electron transfer subunit [Candidatus Bathyarchaeota archaeon]|nr:dihydroorotate dehydrogenase electron transfer subunit [Candidatus Bathyarchaeota archaeon]